MDYLTQFSPFLTKVLLPISLAFIMFGIGLSARLADFSALRNQKKSIIAGFFLQIVGLPLLAFLMMSLFGIRGEYALAFLLVAACPGGATSNAITFIFSGSVVLSVILTLLSSLVAPFSVPFITQLGIHHYLGESAIPSFSLTSTTVKLFVLSIVPLSIGLLLQRFAPNWCKNNAKRIKKYSGWWFLGLIIAMIVTNFSLLTKVVYDIGWFIILLSILSLQLGYWGARLLGLSYAHRLTLAIEVGVQNAGVGLFVAGAVLHNSTMLMILIAYGILMQLPVFIFSYWYSKKKLLASQG